MTSSYSLTHSPSQCAGSLAGVGVGYGESNVQVRIKSMHQKENFILPPSPPNSFLSLTSSHLLVEPIELDIPLRKTPLMTTSTTKTTACGTHWTRYASKDSTSDDNYKHKNNHLWNPLNSTCLWSTISLGQVIRDRQGMMPPVNQMNSVPKTQDASL